ncbi:hypothetical protein RJ035_006817, partial [Blastomyces gilchristii]
MLSPHANFKPWAPLHLKLLSSYVSHHSCSPAASCSPPSKPHHDSPRSTLPPPKHHLSARPPAEVCMSFSTNARPCTPTASQFQEREISIPPSSTPSSENPKHGPLYPHDPAHLTPNSPQIAAFDTQDLTALSDKLPLLERGTAGPGPSSPSTNSSDGSLEKFFRPLVLQNNILIDPAILSNDRPRQASRLVHNCTPPILALEPMHLAPVVWVKAPTAVKLKSLERGVEGLEEQTMKQSQIAFMLSTEEGSFTGLHSHFLSLQLDERLQFLSWLFEGAMASCTLKLNESVQSVVHSDYHEEIEQTQ